MNSSTPSIEVLTQFIHSLLSNHDSHLRSQSKYEIPFSIGHSKDHPQIVQKRMISSSIFI